MRWLHMRRNLGDAAKGVVVFDAKSGLFKLLVSLFERKSAMPFVLLKHLFASYIILIAVLIGESPRQIPHTRAFDDSGSGPHGNAC